MYFKKPFCCSFKTFLKEVLKNPTTIFIAVGFFGLNTFFYIALNFSKFLLVGLAEEFVHPHLDE